MVRVERDDSSGQSRWMEPPTRRLLGEDVTELASLVKKVQEGACQRDGQAALTTWVSEGSPPLPSRARDLSILEVKQVTLGPHVRSEH
jgi:hypothetical protein